MAKKNDKTEAQIKEEQGTFSKILEDLTTLEINTIIKKGMSATAPPERIEDTVKGLFKRYKDRVNLMFLRSEFSFPDGVNINNNKTFEDFHISLTKIKTMLDEEGNKGNRMEETDYTRILRMLAFCDFIQARSVVPKDTEPKDLSEMQLIKMIKPAGKTLYDVTLDESSDIRIDIKMRDKVKINRYYDLGEERVVMQTRFGIDGDVVTRIEEDFSNKPKKLVIDIHDEHTNLSVGYWKYLIDIAKGIIVRDKKVE